MKHVSILTFDLEFWYNSDFIKRHLPRNCDNLDDMVLDSTNQLLILLRKNKTKATFFVLGSLAEKYPEIIVQIAKDGHEIASHGYSHKVISKLTPVEFESEIKKSVKILNDIVGKKPIGFRAPIFSLNNDTKWAIRILKKYGFRYDSSVFPSRTQPFLGGDVSSTVYPLSEEDVFLADAKGRFLELPLAVYEGIPGLKIPIAGGFYFRLFPFPILERMISYRNP